MDDNETEILRANYNEHLKLSPREFYLSMVLAILHQNVLMSPENSRQKNRTNPYFSAQGEHSVAYVEWDLRWS